MRSTLWDLGFDAYTGARSSSSNGHWNKQNIDESSREASEHDESIFLGGAVWSETILRFGFLYRAQKLWEESMSEMIRNTSISQTRQLMAPWWIRVIEKFLMAQVALVAAKEDHHFYCTN
jgi:hypothetical protein